MKMVITNQMLLACSCPIIHVLKKGLIMIDLQALMSPFRDGKSSVEPTGINQLQDSEFSHQFDENHLKKMSKSIPKKKTISYPSEN